jgi:AcrR family transcriptional regulator
MQTFRQPVQARSRATLDRLLEAADDAVTDRSFEVVSVRELCDRAGVSTGAFYARFRRKEDLALALVDTLRDDLAAVVDAHGRGGDRPEVGDAIRNLLTAAIALYRRRAGLLRALTAMARTSPDLARAMRELNDESFGRLLSPPYPPGIRHPNPSVALRLGLLCVLNTLKEIVLDQHLVSEPYPFDDELLVEELTLLFSRYVGA